MNIPRFFLKRHLACLIVAAFGMAPIACMSPSPTRTEISPRASFQVLTVDPAAAQPDPTMKALLEPYAREVAVLMSPIGRTAEAMNKGDEDGAIGSWMADVVRQAAAQHLGKPVDAAFVNRGGIRSNLPEGDVSIRTFMEIMPFDNTVVVFEIDGERMRQLVERLAEEPKKFPISGMTLRIDNEMEGKPRLREATVRGESVQSDRTYRVATSNYLAGGGDNLHLLTEFPPPLDTGVLIRDALIDEARRLNAEGRVIEKPKDLERIILTSEGDAS